MMHRILIPVIPILLYVGCHATVGKQLDPGMVERLKVGSATIAQVTWDLGEPHTVVKSSEDNSTDYQYPYFQAGMGSVTGEVYHFVFGTDGVLVKRFRTQIDSK